MERSGDGADMLKVKLMPPKTNIPGYYRECEEPDCTRLIPCPYIRCQDHRKDFAIDDWSVTSFARDEVEIVN